MDLADPQQMNGYTYGNNNPLVYADPDGKFSGFLEMFKLLKKTIEYFLNKVPNKNLGFARPDGGSHRVTRSNRR